jgi:hypothetical protein
LQEGDSALFALISHDLHEGNAGGIVDADMDELPADALVPVDHAGLPCRDAMSHRTDAAGLLDIEMDEIAWVLALIAPDRFGRLQGAELVELSPFEDAADGCWRDANFGRDLLLGAPRLQAASSVNLMNPIRRKGLLAGSPRRTPTNAQSLRCSQARRVRQTFNYLPQPGIGLIAGLGNGLAACV